jgi:hypothetical protein
MTDKQPEAGPLEIDATELSYEEWFFVWAAMGQAPDANMSQIGEWRQRSLGMTPHQKQMTFRVGFESLIQRGAIKQVGTAPDGQPEYQHNFRVVSRVREVKSAVPPSPLKQ